jgi:hypothetical protein
MHLSRDRPPAEALAVKGQAWLRLFKFPGGSVTLSRRGLGVTGGVGRVRASSRGWSYVRLGKGLYYRRRG